MSKKLLNKILILIKGMENFKFLSESELAGMTDEEIRIYIKAVANISSKLNYYSKNPSCKFWRRIKDIREGKDPNIDNPKKMSREAYLKRQQERKGKK